MILLCVYANIYHTGFWSSNVKNELPLNKKINQKFLRFENIFMKNEKNYAYYFPIMEQLIQKKDGENCTVY